MEKFYTKFTKEYIQAEKERLKKKPKKGVKKNSQNNDIKLQNNVIFEEKNGKKSQNIDTKSQNNVNYGKKSDRKSQNNVNKIQNKFSVVEALFKENKLDKKAQELLENFDRVVQGVRPLNSKQLQKLPENIKELSHQLTDQRSERRLGYMNESVQLSSYVRYYTWWNLVRLTKLFSNLPAESFPNKECICLDIGSGPLTLVISLWLSRPELRELNLTWYCLDVSSNSMALGEDVYLSIVAQTGGTPWKIVRVKGSFGTGTFIKEKADFITCANMFNELDQASDMPPEFQSKKYYDQLCLYKNDDCKFLLVEPGVPKSARTICLLRDRFIKENYDLIGPCSHCGECPMNGFKAYTGSSHKWCNFAFSTENAPAKLLKLSENSKLTKDRATLIFISVVPNKSFDNSTVVEKNISEKQDNSISVRIISDCMKLHNNSFANYGCSKIGLVLVSSKTENAFKSGDLLKIECSQDIKKLPIDKKSGAKVVSL
jgi:hypothetical protein